MRKDEGLELKFWLLNHTLGTIVFDVHYGIQGVMNKVVHSGRGGKT